jgi:integrase/recombinase XerD
MEKIIPQYLSYLQQLGYVAHSIKRHMRNITEFISFAKKSSIINWQEVQAHHISAYLNYLRGRENKVVGGKLSEKTIYGQYRSLQLFYDLLAIKELVIRNPTSEVAIKKPPRSRRRITVTESEIQELYAACKDHTERAILSLNYGCGLRVGGLEQLEIRDLNLDDQYLIIRKGKGNKRRVVPMSIGTIKDLRNYLRIDRPRLATERHYHPNNQSVMLNKVGRPMKEWTFNYTLQRIAKRTANQAIVQKRITTHIMRHSIATHLLHRGLEVHQVRQFLGHVLLSTTQIYTHVNQHQVLQV